MRIKGIMTMAVLLAMAGRTLADSLTAESVSLKPGEKKQIAIGLTNTAHDYVAFQLDLVLPEGITIAKNGKGKPAVSLNEDRKDDHTLNVSEMGGGVYRLLAFSMTNATFYGRSGALVYVTLKADEGVAAGEKTVGIKSQVFTDNSGNQYKWDDTAIQVMVEGSTPPDNPDEPDQPDNPDEPDQPDKPDVPSVRTDSLAIAPVSLSAGETAQMAVALVNKEHDYVAFQLDLVLPAGITIAKNAKGKLIASLNEDRMDDHTLNVSEMGGGVYRLLAFSMTNATFYGKEGALVYVTLQADEAIGEGRKEVALQAQVFTSVEGEQYKWADAKFSVEIVPPVVPEITAVSVTRMYGEVNPALTFTTSAELKGQPLLTTTATQSSPVGSYDITVERGTISGNYTAVNGTLTIEQAPLTIKVGNHTKKQGDPMPEFALTYEGFKNGETEAVLTKLPTISCEATEASAPGEYDIVVSGAEAQNYAISYVAGKLTVTEADAVTVTAKSYTRVYGEDNPTFAYEVKGAALDGQPEISCEATVTSPVGTYPIIIKKGGVTNYNDTYINGTLTITKAPLTVTAKSYTRKQGEQNPEFAVSYEGFVNGETETVLTALPTISCEATEASVPGEYDIVVSGADAANYAISYVAGKLTITEADAVTVTAKSYTRVYGEENPTFEYEVEGAALDGKPEISCEATATSPVGTYPIIIKKGSVKNYNDSYVNGVLTITKAPLTITAQSYSRKQGEKNPEFAVSYEGFVKGETETVLTKQPTISCEATEASKPDVYDIVVSGGEAQNYAISYVAGKLTVTEADAVKVTAQSYTRVYGEVNPTFEYEVKGAALDGQPEISCEATATSPVGTYPIVIKKGGVKNYNDSYVNGMLTITKAPLTVTVGSYTKRQYDAMPEFAVSYEGFVNGETETVLRKLPTVSCEAEKDSQPGEYVITMNGAEAGNYEISYVAGKLTILEPDGISNVTLQKPYIVRICSVGGKPRKRLHKGVNIVVMSDGTTRTVLIK